MYLGMFVWQLTIVIFLNPRYTNEKRMTVNYHVPACVGSITVRLAPSTQVSAAVMAGFFAHSFMMPQATRLESIQGQMRASSARCPVSVM